MRVPLDGRISVRFRNRVGRGNPRSSAVAHRGRQVLFVFAGDQRDAWGRKESTLRFSFDLSDGTGTGTVTPSVTAGWS